MLIRCPSGWTTGQRLARGLEKMGNAFNLAMIRNFDRIISYKHSGMAVFFQAMWGENIENWSGKEGSFWDRTGCLILLGSVAAVISVGYLLLA